MRSKLSVLVLFLSVSVTFCARILVYISVPSFSHQVIVQPIIKQLLERGHQVVSVTSHPLKDPNLTNLTEIDTGFTVNTAQSIMCGENIAKGLWQIPQIKTSTNRFIWEIYDAQLSSKEVRNLIRNESETFDLVITEYYGIGFNTFSERFNCPLIGITSMDLMLMANVAVGNSINPLHRTEFPMSFSRPTNFFERLFSSLFNLWVYNFLNTDVYPELNKLIRKHFGENTPPVQETEKRVSAILVNSHPVVVGARPSVPKVVHIFGILKKPKRPLPNDLKEFLDAGKEGVIYFSLGSNLESSKLSAERRNTLIDTFKDLPYKVLWKYESEELPGKSDNVKIAQWFPQSDVLYHPNVKLFIMQGGVQSWEEAIHAHVPLIVFPMINDQYWNADRIEKLEIGIKMNIDTFDKPSLTEAIATVMNNRTYHNNIKKISDLINDQPMTPLDTAIHWIEFVLRHGHLNLYQSGTVDTPWYQYFFLDVIAFLVVCFAVLIFLIYFITKQATEYLFNRKNKNTKSKIV